MGMNRLGRLAADPLEIARHLRARFFLWRLTARGNVRIDGKVILSGVPVIEIDDGARLEIGDNVTLTSDNRRYHLNLHSPVKLLADRRGAVIKIGDNSRVHGTCIHAYESIIVGRNCLIAANCQIFDCSGHDLALDDAANRIHTTGTARPIVIEDNVWLGAGTYVLPGVVIGEGTVVAANSVVTKSLPPRVLAGGNPAVVLRDSREGG